MQLSAGSVVAATQVDVRFEGHGKMGWRRRIVYTGWIHI